MVVVGQSLAEFVEMGFGVGEIKSFSAVLGIKDGWMSYLMAI